MKTIYNIKAWSVAVLLCSSVVAVAQEETTPNLNREMTLEREYDPSIQDANKVNTLPTIKEPEVRKIPIDYSNLTIPTSPSKEVSLLPSGKILTEMNYNKRRGYLNLAGGTYLNLNGDLGYHLLRTDKDQLNIYFSHRSTNGNVEYLQLDNEKVKAKINDNIGGLNFQHAFDKVLFKLGGKYGYSAFNYYGLPMIPSYVSAYLPADKETNQVTQTIGVYTGIQSKPDAIVGYLLDIDYTNFAFKYGIGTPAEGPTESTISLKGDMNAVLNTNHRVGVGGTLRLLNYNLPPVVARAADGSDYTTYFENRIELLLSPYYRIEGGSWNVQLGAKVGYVTGYRNEWMASPNIAVDATVAEKTVLYAAATGNIQSNSQYDLSQTNRYINPTLGTQPSRTWLDVIAGIKSGVAPGFWFDVFGGYKVISDDFFFVPNQMYYPNDFGNFSNTMSGINSKLLFAGVNLKYTYQQLADFHLKAVYNQWTSELGDVWGDAAKGTEVEAFGRPKMEFTAGITLKPTKQIAIALDYYLATDRYTYYTALEKKFKNINELNGTVSYTFNETVGAYLKVNNVLFQQYEWYYGYPMQGFNIMAGVNLNF